MKNKLFAGVMLAILLVSTFTLALNIQPVEASGTIVIEADGSINPPSANITSSDNITYTFTDNNYDNIVVERNNIIIDGNGSTLQGSGSGVGFELVGRSNVTIKNTNIKSFSWGVRFSASSVNNTVFGNNITGNTVGIRLASSSSNTVFGNNITNNSDGVVFVSSSANNFVSENIIANNTNGVYIDGSSYNTVSGNTITENTDGVYLYVGSNNNTVSGNTITNNTNSGVYLRSFYTIVTGNDIIDNNKGVYLSFFSSNNTFYHNNFINNIQQVYFIAAGYPNFWNNSYPSGGNYWSNYAGVDQKSGPDQGDAGSDGIGDTPHVLDAWNQDNYPYMNESGWVRVRNINTTLGYWAIQEAIDAVETLDGHTIQVDPGIYVENVDVTQQLNITGAGAEATTVKALSPNDHVFNVTANNVTISGFTVKDATASGKAGVYLYYSNYSKIENINATNNYYGVYLHEWSSGNTVSGNTITNNTDYGVWLHDYCNYNTVSSNNITNSTYASVYLDESCNYNTVFGNTIANSTNYGVGLISSSYNTVSSNTITNTYYCVYLSSSSYNTFSGNTITNSTDTGVVLSYACDDNTFSGNTITNSTTGVYLSSSSYNTVSSNTITNNTYGVDLFLSSYNTFYHNNFIDNTQHVYIATPGYANHWNSSYPTGGNYWSNYAGVDQKSGPDQGDAGSDGIGDTPHVLDAWNQDNYPFMNPWGPVHNINTTLNYWAIQEAIDAFETLDGHTIQVDPGIYVENVDVHKQLNIIGAGAEVTTVEASDPDDHVFNATASNVTISGFTVTNAAGDWKAGVYLYYSDYSKIENINATNNFSGVYLNSSSNNNVSSNTIANSAVGVPLPSSSNNTFSGNNITNSTFYGVSISLSSNNTFSGNNITNSTYASVYLVSSSNNTFSGNNIKNSTNYGVELHSSSNNTFSGNTITNNTIGGVRLVSSSNNTFSGNTITNNTIGGISLSSSCNNTVSGNTITNNPSGVILSLSSNNTVSGNTITNSTYGVKLASFSSNNTVSSNTIANSTNVGVSLSVSSNNTFSGNNITNSTFGVSLYLSSNNTFSGNNITNNPIYGVVLSSSSDNKFYHNNFIDNTQQVDIATPSYANFWNSSYPAGGNYWSNYAGADEHSGLTPQVGTGSDGIGDVPHVIDGDNQDNYPFMGQNGWETHPFTIESNVTITDRILTTSTLNFNVSGPPGLLGYINITMPMGLNTTKIKVFLDDTELIPIITNNSTHYFIYFEFILSTHEAVIQFAPAPDVAVTNVTPSKTVVGQGSSMSINVTVQNQGDFTETFNVTVYGTNTPTLGQWQTFWSMGDVNEDGYINQTDSDLILAHFGTSDPQYDIDQSGLVDLDDWFIWQGNAGSDIWTHFGLTLTIEEQTVNNLPAGNSTTITFTWNTAGVAYGNHTITAVADTVPDEIDTTDNIFVDGTVFVTILGDIDGDGDVDKYDFGSFAMAFGSNEGDARYNPGADINGDGDVDKYDFADLAMNYGQSING